MTMSNSDPRRIGTAIVTLAAIAVSVLALAGPSPGANIYVESTDLDLSTRSGLMTLYLRLQDASMMSCDPSGQSRVLPYFNRPDGGDCYSDTLYTALRKVENTAILDIHDRLRLEPIIIE